jgi:DNA mismatch repair protein MutS
MIYDDYIDYCKEYTNKYGKETVVFIQVGDFFELYGVLNDTEQEGADIYKICEMCNIQVTKKNKSIIENSRNNPLMAGFPISAITKFVQIVVSNGYTAVLVRQTTPPPNPKREVTEVISPSTSMNVNQKEGLYLMVVYWDNMNIGLAIVDLTTGRSWVYENYGDIEFSKDEIVRFTNLYEPKEIVYIGTENDTNVKATQYRWNDEKLKHFLKPAYQNLILEKVFGKTGIISPIETFQFDRFPLATIAFCYMIQFAYEHNENIIKDISIPIHLKNNTHLILESNAIYQLNMDSHNNNELHLLKLLNRTVTSFGSRRFREYLFNPILDINELNKRYDKIEKFKEKNLYKEVQYLLQPILDLERINRKIGFGKFQPCEWVSLTNSFENALSVFKLLHKTSMAKTVETIMNDYMNVFDLEECSKYTMTDINTSIFKKGIYPEIDKLTEELKEAFTFLDDLRIKITNIGSGESTLCRLDCNERDGYHLTITKKRWELAKSIISLNEWNAKPVSPTSSVLRLTNKKLDEISSMILVAQRKMSILNISYYEKYQKDFYERYKTLINDIVHELAEIDVFSTNAKNAIEYNYSRPILENGEKSKIRIEGLRHPIIERLNNSIDYVTNDIIIENGTLLYGINASGKSSLMKSVGINVIMAQAGMYVASKQTFLIPYSHIFTRIAGYDNIYRGLSTFTVEMLELKNILNRCDEKSLILGDELCAGTESVSAVAIVASGIDHLLYKKSSFIFATHLHELLEIIKPSSTLSVLHLHIEIKNGKIVYDRKLKNGNGSKVYGLEVCKSLKMDERFLENANAIRKKMQSIPENLVEPKLSKYNSNVYVTSCSLCGGVASETHHIKQQKDADENGYIGHIHKDTTSNLIVLCETCHLSTHHGDKKLVKKVMTTEGVEPVFEEIQKEAEKPDKDLKDFLHYSMKGWKYRFKKTDVWKTLSPTNYETVFKKLSMPMTKEEIITFLEENQSDFLVFMR